VKAHASSLAQAIVKIVILKPTGGEVGSVVSNGMQL
jgi:hypothetical protein